MMVVDRRAAASLLKNAGFQNTHLMTNGQLQDRVRFLTGDKTAQVTHEFTEGFLASLYGPLADYMKKRPDEDNMPAKKKTNGKSKAPPKVVRRGEYKPNQKNPGICRFVLATLKKAGPDNPITKKQIHAAMCERFPSRNPKKMMGTLNKASWWLYHDLGHELRKTRLEGGGWGYWAVKAKSVAA